MNARMEEEKREGIGRGRNERRKRWGRRREERKERKEEGTNEWTMGRVEDGGWGGGTNEWEDGREGGRNERTNGWMDE